MDKLKYENNWYYHVYTIDGKHIQLLTEISINGKLYPVTVRVVSEQYQEMGITSEANSKQYYIKESVFGRDMEFSLTSLMSGDKPVTVSATKYSLQ